MLFYLTVEQFNEERGLAIVGADPKVLRDLDVVEEDWLSLFSHPRDPSNDRIKCSSIPSGLYVDLALFHWKVF